MDVSGQIIGYMKTTTNQCKYTDIAAVESSDFCAMFWRLLFPHTKNACLDLALMVLMRFSLHNINVKLVCYSKYAISIVVNER